ncbi:hypothetical protein Esti_002981 [Eimeria stiedai]
MLRLNRDLHRQPLAAAAAAAAAPNAGPAPPRALGPQKGEGPSCRGLKLPVGGLFPPLPEGRVRSSRGGPPLPLWWGRSKQVANFAEAAAVAAEAAADDGGDRGASGRITTFSEMLEEEDSLSGLSDVYNNRRNLGLLLTRAQMHYQRERARQVEKERISSEGLSPATCRQVQYRGFVPSLARRIPFQEYYIFDSPKTGNRNRKKLEGAQRNSILQHIPLSHAISALLTNTPVLHVDSNTFCDCLETLVLAQGPPAGPLNPRDRSRIRGLLEETFAEMQTSGNDIADAFDLILGLCHFCRSDDDERVKATFALFDKEGKGRLHFFVVAAVFHHLHRILLTPYVADMFRRAQVTFSSVDDLAVASAIEIFKAKYPFLSASERGEKGNVSATATTATRPATPAAAASAAAACAQNKLFVDLTEEPWKSVACHAGLELSYDDFVRVCQDTPKVASMTQTCLLRLPLIVTLRDLIDVEPAC